MPLRSFTQTEKVVTERRRFERPLLITVWLGVAALGLAEGRWFYLFAATLAVGVNLLSLRRDREVYLDRKFVNAAVLISTLILIMELVMGSTSTLQSVGHYVVLIQLCKLFELKTNRDYVQILALSGLVIISASLQCNAVWFAAVLVAYLSLACYTAMAFTLKRGLDVAAAARLATEAAPLAPSQVVWNVRGASQTRRGAAGWPSRVLRRYVTRLLAVAFALGAMMFLAAPRRAISQQGIKSSDRISGAVGDSVILGLGGTVHLSDRVVMKVSGARPPIGGYLRGRVFSRYGLSRWSSGRLGRRPQPGGIAPDRAALDNAIVHDVSMAPELLPTLYVPTSTVWVTSPDGEVTDTVGQYAINFRRWPTRPVRYRAFVAPKKPPGERFSSGEMGKVYVSPRVRRLAEQWCAKLLDERAQAAGPHRDDIDVRIAAVIARRLGQRCTYTLDLSGAKSERDGVEDFLFYMKRGHCEYFASAMTVMCRALGVKARLAVGFRVDGLPAAGGSFVVRQRDAHAWTEVFTPKLGWITFDPSGPSDRREARGVWGAMRDAWESARFFWSENVVGYDWLARKRMGRWLGRLGRAVRLGVLQIGSALKTSAVNLLVGGYIDRVLAGFAVVTGVIGLLLAGVLVLRIKRRHGSYCDDEPAEVMRKQLVFARRLFRLLHRHGRPRPPEQTVRRWARESADELGLSRDAVDELVEMYYALRWGPGMMDDQQLRLAEQKVADLAAHLSA